MARQSPNQNPNQLRLAKAKPQQPKSNCLEMDADATNRTSGLIEPDGPKNLRLKLNNCATSCKSTSSIRSSSSSLIKFNHLSTSKSKHLDRRQLSSFTLFVGVIIFVNLCPFDSTYYSSNNYYCHNDLASSSLSSSSSSSSPSMAHNGLAYRVINFLIDPRTLLPKCQGGSTIKPSRLLQAEAKVLAKMAKMLYIKKKIKKLNKKLKKHTIAVPVFTAIPIYEHSYYPSPHMGHMGGHGGGMHHAASYYAPAYSQVAPSAAASQLVAATSAPLATSSSQQLATSASQPHQTYRMPRLPAHAHMASYHGHPAQQYINSYPASPPMYVDDANGLYGQYGNAYGRYDGGFQYW